MEDKKEIISTDLNSETASIIDKASKSTSTSELQEITELFNANQVKRDMIRANSVNKLMDKIVEQATDRIENRGNEMTNKDLLDYYKTFQDTLDKVSEHSKVLNEQPLIQINNTTQNIEVNNTSSSLREGLGVSDDNLNNVRDFIATLLKEQNTIEAKIIKKGVIIIGADNTGKTSLVEELKSKVNSSVLFQNFQYDEIKDDTSDSYYNKILNLYIKNENIVFERFTPIDELIYGKILHPNINHTFKDLDKYFNNPDFSFLVVYCRPSNEAALDFKDRAQFEGVIENGEKLLSEFDLTYSKIVAHYENLRSFRYNYQDRESAENCIKNIIGFIGGNIE